MFRKKSLLMLIMALSLLAISLTRDARAAGMVTFSFDDGLSSVYQEAFPILQKYHLKATVGIVLNRITSGNDDYLDVAQVKELQGNGWEVASHGLTHKRPTEIPLYLSDEGIGGWELQDEASGVYEAKYYYELISGLLENGKRLRELGSLEEVARAPGSYYFDHLISTVHVHPFEALEQRNLDIRSISYQREMAESKKGLEKLGFRVTTYVAPYNYWTPEMRELSKYYYDQVANGGESANFRDHYEAHWLKRFFIHTLGPADAVIKLLQKNVVEKKGWVILCFHGIEDENGWQPWSAENLEVLAAWLHDQGIKTVTIAEGAATFNSGFFELWR
jgi:peptidoglycan/xylan/chitin deacetylase (PgdA/CDA1 family)